MSGIAFLFLREHGPRLLLVAFAGFVVALLGASGLPVEGREAADLLLLRVGLSALDLLVILPVVFVLAYDLPRDLETGRLLPIVAGPVSRRSVLFGKILGGLALTAILSLLLSGFLLVHIPTSSLSLHDAHVAVERRYEPDDGEVVPIDARGRPEGWEQLQLAPDEAEHADEHAHEEEEEGSPEERRLREKKARARRHRARAAREGRFDVRGGDRLVWSYDLEEVPDRLQVRIHPHRVLEGTFPAIGGLPAEVRVSQPGGESARYGVLLDYHRGALLTLEGFEARPGPLEVALTPAGEKGTLVCILGPNRVGREQRGLLLLRPVFLPLATLPPALLLVVRASVLFVVAVCASTFLSGGVSILAVLFLFLVGNLRSFLIEIAGGAYRVTPHTHGTDYVEPSVFWRGLESVIEQIARFTAACVPDLQALDPTPILMKGMTIPVGTPASGLLAIAPYLVITMAIGWVVLERRDL